MKTSRPSSPPPVARRGARVLATSLALLVGLAIASVALATPASASVPVGWPEADEVNVLNAILVLGGIPLALFVIITLAIYVPALARGERVTPGAPSLEQQWLGGPRRSAGELAGPDTEGSEAGGASGRW